MELFKKSIAGYAKDVVHTATVHKVNFAVCMNRLLAEGGSAVSVWRALFDAFVRCKIRHSDPLQDCCRSPACGDNCCHQCPQWKAWFRPVRTILVMAALAAPSGPFLYAMSSDGLEFQTLSDKIESLGLQRPFDFYAGSVFGKVFVGVLALMYVTHVLIIIIDGSTDENISRLYTEVLDVAEKKDKISKRVGRAQSYIKIACAPIKKCGVLIIPLWIVAVCFLPVVAILSFLIHAPMLQVMIQGVKKILQRANLLKQTRKDRVKFFNACEIFWFFTTAIFVFIVMTIGANFLVNAVVVVIVTVIVQADLIYRVVPVVLILIIYIRDSYSRVGIKYDAYLGTILGTIRNKEAEDLRREALKPIENQQNKVFKIFPEAIPYDPDDEVVSHSKNDAVVANLPTCEEEQRLFSLKNSNVRLHLKQLLLFFSRDDSLYMSKKFLFHCCTMTCAGAPGPLEENYINATLQFAKIGVFLLFVFLVVMAYGSTYYISPTNHLFVTLVSGLIPLIIRNVFSSSPAVETVTTSNYRFEAQLNEKIESFCQSWDVEDMVLKHVQKAPSNSSNTTNPVDDLTRDVPTKHFQASCVDLVLELGDESTQSFHSIPQPRWRSRHKIDSVPFDLSDSKPAPADNIPNPYLHTEDRLHYEDNSERTQPNGSDRLFDNDRHRTEVARAHAEHTRGVLADIDTYTVSNHLLTMFGINPENSAAEDAGSERRGNDAGHTRRNDNNNNTSARRTRERDNHAVLEDTTRPASGGLVVDDGPNEDDLPS
ncbi:unnamed protein product [Lymnaea stagnalis]|uniref:Uncharacterized protein n=1 Tax=Lymnaea stagnalis TaxID=6523 RepID=A0AAV2I4C0_LYMST